LATALDQSVLKAIVKRYEIDMERREPPTDDDVRKRIEERAVLLLEDEWRLRSKDEKALYTSLVDVVRAFWQDGHGAWLAMLIDAFYHKKVHIGGNDLAANRPPSSRDDLSPEQLAPRLEEAIRKKSVLRRSRIERFEKLVDHIVRIEESEDQGEGGEPELLAMLLTDFSEGRLLVEPAPEKKSVEPSRSQKGKRHSGRGAGRRNSSTSRRPRR